MISKRPREDGSLKGVAPYLDLGLRLALAMVLGVYGGYWLDNKLATTPLFLLLGMFIGAASGFMTIYRSVFPTKKDDKKPHLDE